MTTFFLTFVFESMVFSLRISDLKFRSIRRFQELKFTESEKESISTGNNADKSLYTNIGNCGGKNTVLAFGLPVKHFRHT